MLVDKGCDAATLRLLAQLKDKQVSCSERWEAAQSKQSIIMTG